MIHNTNWKVLGGLIVVAVGLAPTGCGQNTAETGIAPTTTTQATTDDHVHAPGDPPHAHEAGTATGDNHDAEIEATMTKFFPEATLGKKPFPFSDDAAAHLSQDAGVKFTGDEKKWQVYEATKGGRRVGLAMMTHSALPDGRDMHIAFAVDPKFVLSHVVALDAPDNAKMQAFVKQMVGKTLKAPFKVGQGLKAPAGLPPQVAQIAADAVKKGLAVLDDNFNAAHGETESAHDGHSHEGTDHTEGDGHNH